MKLYQILILIILIAGLFMFTMVKVGYIEEFTYSYECENGSIETYTKAQLKNVTYICYDPNKIIPTYTSFINITFNLSKL